MIFQKRPKRGKRPNSFEATMPIDNPDIKIVEAKYANKPVLLAVGTSRQRELNISGESNQMNIGAKYKSQKDLEWQILINPKNLPDFVPLDRKLKAKGQ